MVESSEIGTKCRYIVKTLRVMWNDLVFRFENLSAKILFVQKLGFKIVSNRLSDIYADTALSERLLATLL